MKLMIVNMHSRLIRCTAPAVVAILVATAAWAQNDFEQATQAYESGNYEKAFQLWKVLAKDGDAQSQYSLGVMYYKGDGVAVDLTRAIYWFRKAAQQDHVNSLFNVGIAFWEGKGVDRDYFLATEWWRRAAQRNFAPAQYNLGVAYYLGKGVQKDVDAAISWLRKAVENGHEGARQSIAIIESQQSQPSAQAGTPLPPDLPYIPGRVDKLAAKVYPIDQLSDAVVTELSPGTPLRIVGERDEWFQVEAPGGPPVWVYGDFVDADGRISGDRVRARPMPSSRPESLPIGYFENGDKVKVLSAHNRWKRVVAPEKLTAWVQSKDIIRYESLPADWDAEWQSSTN